MGIATSGRGVRILCPYRVGAGRGQSDVNIASHLWGPAPRGPPTRDAPTPRAPQLHRHGTPRSAEAAPWPRGCPQRAARELVSCSTSAQQKRRNSPAVPLRALPRFGGSLEQQLYLLAPSARARAAQRDAPGRRGRNARAAAGSARTAVARALCSCGATRADRVAHGLVKLVTRVGEHHDAAGKRQRRAAAVCETGSYNDDKKLAPNRRPLR